MTAVPPGAITAAAVAIHDADCPDRTCSGSALGHCYRLAQSALEAAAPLIAAAAWRDGYGQGRDDEADGLPLRKDPL